MKRLTLVDKAFFLKKSPMFSSLDLDLLLAISDKLNLVTFDAQKTIFGIGEEAFRMYFIVKGSVQIKDAKGQLLCELCDEDFFGDEALFNEKPRAYEVVSKTETVLLTLTKTNLLTVISECPSVAVGLLQAYTSAISFRQR